MKTSHERLLVTWEQAFPWLRLSCGILEHPSLVLLSWMEAKEIFISPGLVYIKQYSIQSLNILGCDKQTTKTF